MNAVSPSQVLEQVAKATPSDCHDQILIIGSLAAGYHFFKNDPTKQVRTKDVDCVIYPHIKAVPAGQKVANSLLKAQRFPETEGDYAKPGTANTPDNDLPAVRLYPPDSNQWFLELLTVPESEAAQGRRFTRIKVEATDQPDSQWHFGLPSFRFLALTQWEPIQSEFGIFYARPSMMALANLLEHPKIGTETMSKPIAGRTIKRSNKDLGRSLALAYLTDIDELDSWAEEWSKALEVYFPNTQSELRQNLGNGIDALLKSPSDLEEALHTCNNGLLSSSPISLKQLEIIAFRLRQDVMDVLR